jgi:predicted P-loop ATPase
MGATTKTGIDSKHWQEWVQSGVSPRIIELNIRSLHNSYDVDKLLNRNTKRTWKRPDELVPCWQVSGLDPLTGEASILGVQIKPDIAPINKDGKTQKYIGATGFGASPLFLDTGRENYWKTVIDDNSIPILLTEGAKKAGAGLSIGKATISIPGVSTCRKNGRLHHLLSSFTGFGRIVYFAFDNDLMQKRPVQQALIAMAREFSAKGSKVMVIQIPPGDLKGMDDFIANNGEGEFQHLVDNALTIEEWKQKLEQEWQQQEWEGEDERKSKVAKYFSIVRNGWGDGLRMNKLKTQIELNGTPLDLNHIRQRIAMEFDTDVPIGDSQAIVEMLAGDNEYNPVVDYLDTLALSHPDIDTSILDNLATRYFGTSDPLYNIYMKRCLIASVARVRHPGCKHDTATILVGKQGAFKSTFWKVLYGEDWFSDELGDASEKDELMKLHRFWCLEWSEFETVYRKKDVAALKKFMTSPVDAFRTPYSRTVKEYPRASVLVGTTNEKEILSDPSGSRRFWVIPLATDKIPVDQLVAERDRLWAAANALYNAGHAWWLIGDEKQLHIESNREFEVNDPWTQDVQNFVRGKDYVTTSQVLNAVGVETARQDIALAKRVGSILRKLGWDIGTLRENGYPVKVWRSVIENKKNVGNLLGSLGSLGSPQTDVLDTPQTPLIDDEQKVQKHSYEQKSCSTNSDHPLDFTQSETQPLKSEGDPSDPSNLPKLFTEKTYTDQGCVTPQYKTSLSGESENEILSNLVNNDTECQSSVNTEKLNSEAIKSKFASPCGEIKAIASEIEHDLWEFHLMYPDGSESKTSKLLPEDSKNSGRDKATSRLKQLVNRWIAKLRFKVTRPLGVGKEEIVGNCKFIDKQVNLRSRQGRGNWVFEAPNGERINVFYDTDFEVQLQGS